MIEVAAAAVSLAAASAYAVRGRSSAFFGPSVYRGDPARPSLALTFDDGPSESTPHVLEILNAFGAKATFFQCGANAERLPEIARQVSAAGHQIGNHTHTHPRLPLKSPRFVADQVERAQRVLTGIHGEPPRLFRAPYGARWFGLRAVQVRHGLLGVMWTTIALDWKLPAPQVVRRLKRGAANGAILCLHDGRGVQSRPDIRATLAAVGELVPWILDQGYTLEKISKLICPMTSSHA